MHFQHLKLSYVVLNYFVKVQILHEAFKWNMGSYTLQA